MFRAWAFWRRVEYLIGFFILFALVGVSIYYSHFYTAPTCFDSAQNGTERGVDCGGSCTRICSFDMSTPTVLWSRSFRVTNGQYNAVAYIENQNLRSGTPSLAYTFKLYDSAGLIIEKSGTTVLPPNGTYAIFEGRINTGKRIPTQTTIDLQSNDAIWLPATIGREQFIVEKRDLKSADSRPVLNATLSNTLLEEAQKVDVVATIFDSKGNALTSSATFVELFGGRATNNLVFTWPEPIAKTVRSCEIPTDVMLAIDLSGSMNDDGGTPPEPVTSVLRAAGSFVSRLKSADQIGVITFATDVALKNQLTNDKTTVASAIGGFSISKADETGTTDTGDAILRATDELNSSRHNTDARKVLVLLSDGLANAPGKDAEKYALDAAAKLKAAGVDIYTIGLGTKVNDAFMTQIASDAAHYLKAPSASAVDAVYKTITSSLCEDGAAVIDIIPKTASSFAPLQ